MDYLILFEVTSQAVARAVCSLGARGHCFYSGVKYSGAVFGVENLILGDWYMQSLALVQADNIGNC